MRNRAFCLAALCAVFLGCSDDATSPQNNASRLSSAKALWEATRPIRYVFFASRACECVPDAGGPVRIEVNGTSIVSVTHAVTDVAIDPALWFTIDGLFALVQQELQTRPSRLEAQYDESNGHPTYVAYGEREVDSGAIVEVSQFTTLIGGTGGYLRR